jgi:hypothetical protein
MAKDLQDIVSEDFHQGSNANFRELLLKIREVFYKVI